MGNHASVAYLATIARASRQLPSGYDPMPAPVRQTGGAMLLVGECFNAEDAHFVETLRQFHSRFAFRTPHDTQ